MEREEEEERVGPCVSCSPPGSPTLWMSQGTMSHGVMVAWGSPGSCSQLCPFAAGCWGSAVLPSGLLLMLLSKTHPGRAEFVPGARLVGPKQRRDAASKQPPTAVLRRRALGC